MEKTNFKNTTLYGTRFGFGALSIGPSHLNLDIKEGAKVIEYAVNSGINVIDTAEYYDTYKYIKEALKNLNRNELIISSKSLVKTYDEMINSVNNCLKELEIEYIDIFFLHEIRSGQFFERAGAWNALIDMKNKGKIKYIGISTHHIDQVELMESVKECDIVFGLINKNGMGIRTSLGEDEINNLTPSEKKEKLLTRGCLDKMGETTDMLNAIHKVKKAGKVFYAMKAFGGGNLVNEYQCCLDFLDDNPDIDCIMIGLGNKKEIDDLVSYSENKLDKSYNPDTSKKIVRVNPSDCEGCGTCIKMCASNAISYDENGFAKIDPNKCITCGYCAQSCPARAIVMY